MPQIAQKIQEKQEAHQQGAQVELEVDEKSETNSPDQPCQDDSEASGRKQIEFSAAGGRRRSME